ncbi:hypothetical protein KUCAC02_026641 [Chaenocephalus aceratus]|nr:hypothetical protein KUCAC02_026641 [Chaenocephalus aceratus]
MEQKDKDYPELSDPKWIMDLAFLVDMLCRLDRLNLDLQGNKRTSHRKSKRTSHRKKQTARYAILVETLQENFATRIHDLHAKRPQITFLVDSFNAETDCLKAPLVKDEAVAELEMIELSEDDRLKSVLREGALEFWKTVPIEKYPNVKRAALKLLLMFWVNIRLKECQKSH